MHLGDADRILKAVQLFVTERGGLLEPAVAEHTGGCVISSKIVWIE